MLENISIMYCTMFPNLSVSTSLLAIWMDRTSTEKLAKKPLQRARTGCLIWSNRHVKIHFIIILFPISIQSSFLVLKIDGTTDDIPHAQLCLPEIEPAGLGRAVPAPWRLLLMDLASCQAGSIVQRWGDPKTWWTVHEWVAWWPSSVADSICISVLCRVWGFRGDWRGDRPKIFG